MTNQQLKQKASDEFRNEIDKELGYCSALFMSQECKGTEIVMPTKELKEISDRIELYFFAHQSELEKAAREEIINEIMKICESIKKEPQQILGEMVETELSDRGIGYNKALADLIQELKSLR